MEGVPPPLKQLPPCATPSPEQAQKDRHHGSHHQATQDREAQPFDREGYPVCRVTAEETIADSGSYTLQTSNADGTHALTTGATDGAAAVAGETVQYDAANQKKGSSTSKDALEGKEFNKFFPKAAGGR